MKFFLYFLCWISSIHAVNSAVVSSAYEALFFYYAYQIDAAAKSAATAANVEWTQTLGTKCEGVECTFGSFVKSILSEEAAAALTPTSYGDSTTPEIYETAQDIIANWKYEYKELQTKSIITGTEATWKAMITGIVDKIQAARAVTPQADLVKKATTALRWAQAARLTDLTGDVNAETLTGEKAKAFKAQFTSTALKSTTRELATDSTGSESRSITYGDLDYEGMASNAAELVEYQEWAQQTPKKGSYRSHRGFALLYDQKGTEMETGCSP
ncbi:hypothetical protein N7451_005833 [Penicillium sp. IBT 35674x]|nr:hypothetical protein N7451_005833 [Penicillium sp. IBT 35674x]